MKALTKHQLIRALEKAECSPKDIAGILGKVGLTALGGIGGAAAASTLFATTITSTVTAPVLGSVTLGGWLGATAVVTTIAAAPVTLIIGGAATGVTVSYGMLRLFKNGERQDRKHAEYVAGLRQKIDDYNSVGADAESASESLARLAGMYALLLKLDVIDVAGVTQIFEGIDRGVVELDFALKQAKAWLDSLDATQQGARVEAPPT